MRTVKIGLLLAILAAIAATATVLHSQNSNSSTSVNQQDVDEGSVPIADYAASLPSDLKERTKRVKRNKRYNMDFKFEGGRGDARKFMLTEARESSYGSFPTHAPAEPAIPAASSVAIVIGEITNEQAYLSEDKTSIYSEFNVNVSEVLKNTDSNSLIVGAEIAVSRGGGAVRFPSGKVIRRLFEGKPMPQIGQKYVFFLNYNKEGQDYPIITAYEIRNGKIVPLDGLLKNGKVVEQLVAHQSYRGASEAEFLSEIQAAISTTTDVFEERRQQ